jgi:hypothetical protein
MVHEPRFRSDSLRSADCQISLDGEVESFDRALSVQRPSTRSRFVSLSKDFQKPIRDSVRARHRTNYPQTILPRRQSDSVSRPAKKCSFFNDAETVDKGIRERPGAAAPRRAMSAVCDYCSNAKATVFCRADSARLCLSCDAQVRPNPFSKTRGRDSSFVVGVPDRRVPNVAWGKGRCSPRPAASRARRSASFRRPGSSRDASPHPGAFLGRARRRARVHAARPRCAFFPSAPASRNSSANPERPPLR